MHTYMYSQTYTHPPICSIYADVIVTHLKGPPDQKTPHVGRGLTHEKLKEGQDCSFQVISVPGRGTQSLRTVATDETSDCGPLNAEVSLRKRHVALMALL